MSPRSRTSAGIALFRRAASSFEVLLVHPGGPLFTRRDLGAWSFPKGEYGRGDDALEAARREFEEEIGSAVDGPFIQLAPVTQKGGKVVSIWAAEGDCDVATVRSNLFSMEWPRGSGQQAEFPEVDRAEWFDPETAMRMLNPAQAACVVELQGLFDSGRWP